MGTAVSRSVVASRSPSAPRRALLRSVVPASPPHSSARRPVQIRSATRLARESHRHGDSRPGRLAQAAGCGLAAAGRDARRDDGSRRTMKARSILALLACLAVPVAAHAQDAVPATVRIATEGAYAPYNFTKPDGSLDGFEIELGREVSRPRQAHMRVHRPGLGRHRPGAPGEEVRRDHVGMNITEARLKVNRLLEALQHRPFRLRRGRQGAARQAADERRQHSARQRGRGAEGPRRDQAAAQRYDDRRAGLDRQRRLPRPLLKGTAEIREYKTTEQHDLDLAAGRIDAIFANDAPLRATAEKPDFAGTSCSPARASSAASSAAAPRSACARATPRSRPGSTRASPR